MDMADMFCADGATSFAASRSPKSETIVAIFVRHTAECKYAGDVVRQALLVLKHLRWTHNSKQRYDRCLSFSV